MHHTTDTVLMVSPTSFSFNAETAKSNVFQHRVHDTKEHIQMLAEKEWKGVSSLLEKEGVCVLRIADTPTPVKPDALFPNNWITTHEDGRIILYPLLAKNRRIEKRADIIAYLQKKFQVSELTDLSSYEHAEQFLEGTGSVVFDRVHAIAYACLSARTHSAPLEKLGELLGYETVAFHAFDHNKPIYHTNVLMSVGSNWAAICFDAIPDATERDKVRSYFLKTGKEIIELSMKQLDAFAGNILELKTGKGTSIIVMSQTTFKSLDVSQTKILANAGKICVADVSTIERVGGGGIRCLIAEIFLTSVSG